MKLWSVFRQAACRVRAGAFLLAGMPVLGGLAATAEPTIDFNAQIRPLLSSRCYPCHGPDEEARKAKLRLDLVEESVRERDGIWPIKPGRPDESEVMARIQAEDRADLMPPPKAGERLSESEVDLIRRWILEGAEYSEHWAWKKPARPVVPAVQDSSWPINEIDRFILARQEAMGLKPSSMADDYVLARRVSLDLTGLPPEVPNDKWLNEGYEELVDELLASPHYGERWARVWLDLARFADSAGYGSDPLRPNLWPWRDWLIDALNRNLPYDRFTIEQIAGDLLPEPSREQVIATAFHRNTMTNTEGGTDDEEFRVAAVKDRANTTAQVWMGLTLGCAQCHSHKFDPISQREYYRFFAFFNQTEDNDQPDERPTLELPTASQEAQMTELGARIERLERLRAADSSELDADVLAWETAQSRGIEWVTLQPAGLRSRGAATLAAEEDGFLSVAGGSGVETYVITAPIGITNVTGLRLELEPDPRETSQKQVPRSESDAALLTEVRVTFQAAGKELPRGRFVRVELPGLRRVLSLAEVQVLNEGENRARSGVASQSSTNQGASPDLAIDGRTDGHFEHGSVSETRAEDSPWWEVDLGEEQGVEEIVVWNRTDGGLGTRMSDFKVDLLDAKRVQVWTKSSGAAPNPVMHLRVVPEVQLALQNASTRYVRSDRPVKELIDGNPGEKNGWAPGSPDGGLEAVAFEVRDYPDEGTGGRLTFFLTARAGIGEGLRQFRLSATDAPHPVRELPESVRLVLAIPAGNRSQAEADGMREYVRDFAPSLKEVELELQQTRDALAAVKPVALPILRELASDRQRVTRVLHKGNFLDPGEAVEPGVPAAFHAWPTNSPRNRLGLAQWLASPENPLTARVLVNRLWAQLFGVGLVETEEDFGTQGSLPSHPELLDWLAVEFMERGWDMKAMIRLMVTSATYRQSAVIPPELLAADPRNRWLARAPRLRLDAETVRDQALALSGLIHLKVGGPSVFPPQPDGLWRAAFNGERDYPTSVGEDRYRRGVYVFLRRTVPNPTLSIFDAPSREVCSFRRLPTNTPLQAFVTLNDPVFVEAAQAMARRMVSEGGAGHRERVRYGLRLCLGRPPTALQEEILVRHFEEEHAHYSASCDDARKLAAEPENASDEEVAELAAWTSVANVLLNLDALLNRG
jgi:hypothetical protein